MLKPHVSNYWLQPKIEHWEEFVEQTSKICVLLSEAAELSSKGIHVMSTDEKTGIQALQRDGATLAAKPGRIEKREFTYIRHGTQVLMANLEIATGKLLSSSVRQTRKEADFLVHIQHTVAIAPEDEWILIVDGLNTHYSASLVEWVASSIHDKQALGEKGKSGVLQNKKTRMAYLSDAAHKIRFVYTPTHCSWLNPVEVWFSGLTKRVLQRGNFCSTEDLAAKLVAYIEYYNEKLAKAFSWSINSEKSFNLMIHKIKRAVSKIMA